MTAGAPERHSRAKRLANGIPIDETSWGEILAAARDAGVGDPAPIVGGGARPAG
jgi:hydroxycarboxylate dehydrogenase B